MQPCSSSWLQVRSHAPAITMTAGIMFHLRAGVYQPQPQPMDTHELQQKYGSTRVRVAVDPEVPRWVMADEFLLDIVLSNSSMLPTVHVHCMSGAACVGADWCARVGADAAQSARARGRRWAGGRLLGWDSQKPSVTEHQVLSTRVDGHGESEPRRVILRPESGAAISAPRRGQSDSSQAKQ